MISREARLRKIDEAKGRLERRMGVTQMELRESPTAGAGDGWTLEGFASVTGTSYRVGNFTETIVPGAFKRTLSESPDVVLLGLHNGLPMARTKAGTLDLREIVPPAATTGLWFSASLDPEDPDAQTVKRKLDRGDLDGQCSFAFMVNDDAWNEALTDRQVRAVSLHRGDVSIVVHAANEAATAALRSRDGGADRLPIPDYTTRARQQIDALRLRHGLPRPSRQEPSSGARSNCNPYEHMTYAEIQFLKKARER